MQAEKKKSLRCRSIVFFVTLAYTCACPMGELSPCEPHWFPMGWSCPYPWRPRDLHVQCGSVVRLGPSCRMWTGRYGEPQSELFRSRGLCGLCFEVMEVHRTKHYTQAKLLCNETQLLVWVNLWHRYDRLGRGRGVQWAVVLVYGHILLP